MTDKPKPVASAKAYISHTQYQTVITSGKHSIISDEPIENDGSDTGMNPFELLLASLSACTAITLQMYISRKRWVVDEITVDMQLYSVENSTQIKSNINYKGNLTDEQLKRIKHIADVCPVHKILSGPIYIETVIL